MANIYDISKRAGVSIATVSRVINGRDRVSTKTRERVLAAMGELRYTPNAFARGLGLNTMKTIGIMVADISDPFFANAVYYLEGELRKSGYQSILCCTGFALGDRQGCLSLLLDRRVDAVILVGSSYSEADPKNMEYIKAAAEAAPIIMINACCRHPNIHCVVNDDYRVVYQTVSRLAERGRRRIMFLCHGDTRSSREKLRGYKDALRDRALALEDALLLRCENDIDATCALLTKRGHGEADGVVASADLLAVGFLKYAKQTGISVPGHCEVVGFSNSILARCCEPELSSVDCHVETLCLTAVSLLLRLFAGEHAPSRIEIAGELVERQTTAGDFY